MVVYFSGLVMYLFICLIIKIFHDRKDQPLTSLYLVPFFIIFGVISAGRDSSVGVDTMLYKNLFLNHSNSNVLDNILNSKYPAYEFYSIILHNLFPYPQTIIIFNSLITLFFISVFIKYWSKDVFISSFLYVSFYFFFYSLNIGRQYLALSLLTFAVVNLMRKKMKLFWSLYIVAILIHNTAIVGIIFYVISKVHWNMKKYGIFSLITISVFLIYERIISLFIRVFPAYVGYFTGAGNKVNLMTQSEGNKLYLTLFYAIFLIAGLLLYSSERENKKIGMLNAIMIVSTIIGLIFSKNILIGRIEQYFTIYIIVYVPQVINLVAKHLVIDSNKYKYKYIYLIVSWGTMIVSLIPLLFQLLKNISGVNPYSFFL